MQFARMKWGAALTVAGLPILLAGPLNAAEQSGVRTVAEELGSRTKPQAALKARRKA